MMVVVVMMPSSKCPIAKATFVELGIYYKYSFVNLLFSTGTNGYRGTTAA